MIPQPSDIERNNISKLIRLLSPLKSHLLPNVLITEVVAPIDRRGTSGELDEAITDEIVKLLKKLGFRVVVRQEIGEEANLQDGRFVLAIKNDRNDKEVLKARYVVQRQLHRDKRILVDNLTTVSQ